MNFVILGGLVLLLFICIIIFILISRHEPPPPHDPNDPHSKLIGSTRFHRRSGMYRKPMAGNPLPYHNVEKGQFIRRDPPQQRD